MESNETLDDNETINCNKTNLDYKEIQYYYVCFVGGPIAIVSIVENILVLYILLGNKCFRQKTYVYQIVLALMDIFSGIGYIFVLALVAYYEYLESYELSFFWHAIVVPGTVLTRMAQDSTPYLLVAVSVERYLTANFKSDLCVEKTRYMAIAGAIFTAVFIHFTSFWELQIAHHPNCPPPSEWEVQRTQLTFNHWYQVLWMFGFRSVLSVFLPFTLLCGINGSILLRDVSACQRRGHKLGNAKTMKKKPMKNDRLTSFMVKGQTMGWARRAKTRVKISARRTFVALVATHLCTRALSVVICGFEVTDFDFLLIHGKFYTLASDTASILSCLICAIRLPIYMICDLRFRQEVSQRIFRIQLKTSRSNSLALGRSSFSTTKGQSVRLQRNSFAAVVRSAVEQRKSLADIKSQEEGTPLTTPCLEGDESPNFYDLETRRDSSGQAIIFV